MRMNCVWKNRKQLGWTRRAILRVGGLEECPAANARDHVPGLFVCGNESLQRLHRITVSRPDPLKALFRKSEMIAVGRSLP